MALLASSVLPSTLNIKVKQFKYQHSSQLHGFLLQLNGHRRVSPKCGMRITMARFGKPNKIKEQLNIIKEKLWEHTPDSVKDFPWKKAENLLLQRLLSVGHKAKCLRMKCQLLAIGGFFVVVKFVSTYFAIRTRVFLLHVVNGGLMQVLWLWRSLLEENGGDEGNLFSMQDGSSAADTES
ncbi:hypothetical protein CRYUN_Cryun35bG0043100 [Craigia yunnanensis]